jgi:hypothetical protein
MLTFKLSQIGFGLNCDVSFTNRVDCLPSEDEINKLKNGSTIFIDVCPQMFSRANSVIELFKERKIKGSFYLMKEPVVSRDVIETLKPVSTNIFVQSNIYDDDNVHAMPIGIRDCGKVVEMCNGFWHKQLLDEGKQERDKEFLCYLCFTCSTHPSREHLLRLLGDKGYVCNLNKKNFGRPTWPVFCGTVPVDINYEHTNKSVYALCPQGEGVDTHRFWECIYLNTIPIVIKTNTAFDKVYNVFPCLAVNSWEDITEEYLLSKKDECQHRMKNFKSQYPNMFTDLNSIEELLLKT